MFYIQPKTCADCAKKLAVLPDHPQEPPEKCRPCFAAGSVRYGRLRIDAPEGGRAAVQGRAAASLYAPPVSLRNSAPVRSAAKSASKTIRGVTGKGML